MVSGCRNEGGELDQQSVRLAQIKINNQPTGLNEKIYSGVEAESATIDRKVEEWKQSGSEQEGPGL